MTNTFVALDVETANSNFDSICQIGIISFDNGAPSHTWQTLVNPEDDFDPLNISIHHITETMVEDAPTFPIIYPSIVSLLSGQIVAAYSSFDKASITRILEKYSLPPIPCTWLDIAMVARRAWPQYATRGYGLANVAHNLGIHFEHHAAHEDARAAGEILLRAISETGLSLTDWLTRVKKPISPSAKISLSGNPDGPLAGETIVFTGELKIPRQQAAALAAQAGCDVNDSITRRTTLLVVSPLDHHDTKSGKRLKAEALIAKGQSIRILSESDFYSLIQS